MRTENVTRARILGGPLFSLCLLLAPVTLSHAQGAGGPVDGADVSREPFVIERLRSRLRFEADGTGSKAVENRVRLQTEGSLKQFGQLILDYNSDFERLSFAGRVIKPDGAKAEIPASAVQDMSAPVSQIAPMYSDIRQKHVIVPGLRPGDVLEYELRFELFAAMAPRQFWAAYVFNRADIVQAEELHLDVPAGLYVNVKSRPEYVPDVREVEGRRVYTWKSANLKRIETPDENKKALPFSRRDPEEPSVQVATFRTWSEVGDWYATLEADRRAPDDAMRARVAELIKGRTEPVDKLRALYRYVAQEYRYVSLSFGVGRYQPHLATAVFGNRYGDCKDKHTLLAAMAGIAGLRLQAALTSATRTIDTDFPSPLQFDHVISHARLGAEEIWLDTTPELAPFRMLLAPIRKKHALVVAGDGGSVLTQIPADPVVPNSQVTTVEGALDDLGTLDADVRLVFRGDAELMGRIAMRVIPQAKWKDYLQFVADAAGVGGEVTGVEISDLADVENPLEYRFHVRKQNYFNRFGKDPKLALPLGTFLLLDPDDAEDGKPIELGKSRLDYRLKLRLSLQFGARPPVPVELKRDYAQYSSRYELEGSDLIAERSLETKVDELPADRRQDFQAFRSAVFADADQKVAVRVGGDAATESIAGGDSDELLEAASAAYDSRDYKTSIELLERLLKTHPDHAAAYADLGRAYLRLIRFDKAEAALKKAIELNPFSPSAYDTLGRLYGMQDRHAEAEKQFRKQIEVVPLDPGAHTNLGEMLVERKKYAEAVPILEKAVAIAPEDAHTHMVLGKAQLSLGRTESALQSFDRAVEIAPSPVVWNDIAYALAERSTGLDRAQLYGESSVSMLTAQLRGVRLEQLKGDDLLHVRLLGASWDTLGWVHFLKGRSSTALKYLNAAWELTQDGSVADHLGQLHERAGKRELAIEYYALAVAEPGERSGSRKRLAALVGESQTEALVNKQRPRLGQLRSYDVPGAAGDGTAEFFVALTPGPKVAEVRFVSGDPSLKRLADTLKSVRFKMGFPDEGDARVFRRGILSCEGKKPAAGSCAFILMNPEDVRSVN
jgi:tetratricopeptide (TPR) repeat protein